MVPPVGLSLQLNAEVADRTLIARLELDPQGMSYVSFPVFMHDWLTISHSDDLEFLPVLASLPPEQTILEYLIGCWKRLNASRSAVLKKVRVQTYSRRVTLRKYARIMRRCNNNKRSTFWTKSATSSSATLV